MSKKHKKEVCVRFGDAERLTAAEIRRRYLTLGWKLWDASVFGGWFLFESPDGQWLVRVKFHALTRLVEDITTYLRFAES